MEKTYSIQGMTCGSCVAKVKKQLEALPQILQADIQLQSPQAKISFERKVDLLSLQNTISQAGNYSIQEVVPETNHGDNPQDKGLSAYKPLFLIIAFIVGTSILVQFPFTEFSTLRWMRHFMAGFFIVFSFFKLLNIEGFSNSYRMYDIVAAKWTGWGYAYPFVELALGICYLINFAPLLTNATTAIVLGISSIGVIKSNLNKQKIKCACLGDVFNLPMSTVTIVEDVTMFAMALVMLGYYIFL